MDEKAALSTDVEEGATHYRVECSVCSLREFVPDVNDALDLHQLHVEETGDDHFVEFERVPRESADVAAE